MPDPINAILNAAKITQNGTDVSINWTVNARKICIDGSYGSHDEVLTRTGTDDFISWQPIFRPYYFQAHIPDDGSVLTTSTTASDGDINKWEYDLSGLYNNHVGDLSSNKMDWVCPENGLYSVYCRLNIYAGNGNLREGTVALYKSPNFNMQIAQGYFIVSTTDNGDTRSSHANPSFYELVEMNSGERLRVGYSTQPSAIAMEIYHGAATRWIIQRVA